MSDRPITGRLFVPVLEYEGTVAEWHGPAERTEEDAVEVLRQKRRERRKRKVVGARLHVSGIIHVPLRELA